MQYLHIAQAVPATCAAATMDSPTIVGTLTGWSMPGRVGKFGWYQIGGKGNQGEDIEEVPVDEHVGGDKETENGTTRIILPHNPFVYYPQTNRRSSYPLSHVLFFLNSSVTSSLCILLDSLLSISQ